jgi:lipoprotein-anchoring transpeptidase ErfK/SrfK
MPSRRQVLMTGFALGAVAATGARAQDAVTAALPPELTVEVVALRVAIPAGEIHVDPNRFALYWTLPGGRAIRYPCGVARPGLYEAGVFYVGAKKEWPSWTPTPEMIAREPERFARYADGMPGGPDNPLGARALYLFTPERGDTFLRIHGTNQPFTIGQTVSNGCARLLNEHIIDLYDRVPLGAKVVLYPKDPTLA